MNEQIINLRKELHKFPELSGQEFETQKRIKRFIKKLNPCQIIEFEGMTGIAFVFEGKEKDEIFESSDPFKRVGTLKGKTIMFRADMDAIPVMENTNLSYKSANNGVAHACGHDGHMAILCGLAMRISKNRPQKGRVVLLFQPAEETGDGAKRIIEHQAFKSIEPDYIFGLHNIPGAKKNQILLKANSITSASKGIIIDLIGKTSHASQPEKGKNPVNAIQKIISEYNKLLLQKELFTDWILLSFLHIKMGEINYGISPGNAKIIVSLRAFNNDDLAFLTKNCVDIAENIAKQEGLEIYISEKEVYHSIVNNSECVDIIEKSAIENNLQIKNLKEPFTWAEDFSYFTNKYKGAFFGLGAGTEQAKLHYANYNFPDEIIETGVELFYKIYETIRKK